MKHLEHQAHRTELTNREKQVISLVAIGLRDKEIRAILHMTSAMIKHCLYGDETPYRLGIYNKLGASNRAEAAAIWARMGN